MTRRITKGFRFLLGIVLTGVTGGASTLLGEKYAKEGSLFINTAHADIVNTSTGAPFTGIADGCGGPGDGGCSDGCY